MKKIILSFITVIMFIVTINSVFAEYYGRDLFDRPYNTTIGNNWTNSEGNPNLQNSTIDNESLVMNNQGSSASYRVYRNIQGDGTIDSVETWIKHTNPSSEGYLSLVGSLEIVRVGMVQGDIRYYAGAGWQVLVTSPNVTDFYKFEVRNISWDGEQFDVSINDNVLATNISFWNSETEINELRFSLGDEATTRIMYVENISYGNYPLYNTTSIVTDIEVNWDSLTPTNDSNVNQDTEMQYDVTVTGTTIKNCTIYINDVFNQTNSSVNVGTNQFIIPIGNESTTYTSYIECYSDDGDYNTTTRKSIDVDLINPDVTWETPDQIYVQDVDLKFSASDEEGNLYAYEVIIYASNSSVMYEDNGSMSGNNYSYSYILSLLSYPIGTYTGIVNISDSHTKEKIKDYKAKVDLTNKDIDYETEAGNVKVRLQKLELYNDKDDLEPSQKDKKNDVNKISTTKEKDRYTFRYESDKKVSDKGEIFAFTLELQADTITKVEDTTYNAHYVLGEGIGSNWFDCEDSNIVKTTEEIVDGVAYMTLYSTSNVLECHSIGGLNFDYDTFSFEVATCSGTWGCNQYGNCNTTDQRPCTNVTGAPSQYCNNSIYISEGGDYDELIGSCNYCTEDIQTIITNGTCTLGSLDQTTLYWDDNYATCCEITNITTDCSIVNGSYTNGTQSISCINYEVSYTSSDLVPIVADGIGTAGASFVGWIGIIMMFLIIFVGVRYFNKYKNKVKE